MPAAAPDTLQLVTACLFGIAVVHTFASKRIERLSHRFPSHAPLFHLLGEVEVVFGFWAIVMLAAMAVLEGPAAALSYAESRQYTEPMFVFVVMVIAASRPIFHAVTVALGHVANLIPMNTPLVTAWLGLAIVPLLGSAITEPAAMTIAAMLLALVVFRPGIPTVPKYFALGVLFVNISIGGTLSSFAAPPVLMVASAWNWDSAFMLNTFGWKAVLAVLVNATLAALVLARHLRNTGGLASSFARSQAVPAGVVGVHFAFLGGVILLSHHPVAFINLFLIFLGFTQAYNRHQNPLILKEALLVAFFLAGLVVLGGMQQWWLQPIVEGLSPRELFFGAVGLTAITDNAALTYLGTLVEGISDESKVALVSGAVVGGGLTVIANAPNPAGVALLKGGFTDETVSAAGLLLGALIPTCVAMASFAWI